MAEIKNNKSNFSGNTTQWKQTAEENEMDQLTKDLSENQKILDSLLFLHTSAGEFFCVNHSAVVESLQQEDGLSDKGPSKDLVDFAAKKTGRY